MNDLVENIQNKVQKIVPFENLIIDPTNFKHKIKGMSYTVNTSPVNSDLNIFLNVEKYFEKVALYVRSWLPVKDRYQFNIIKNAYVESESNEKLLSLKDFVPNVISMIQLQWSSIIYIQIPEVSDPYPIMLNYSLGVPDCYPFVPTCDLDEIFTRLKINADYSSHLDYVEMADYDSNAFPDIVYFNKDSERFVISGSQKPNEYFLEFRHLYLQEILGSVLSGGDFLNLVYRKEVFDILKSHIIQSLKFALNTLIKTNLPLVIPNSEEILLRKSGKIYPRRKITYYSLSGEVIAFGFGTAKSLLNEYPTTVEWVKFSENNKGIVLRIIERPQLDRMKDGGDIYDVNLAM